MGASESTPPNGIPTVHLVSERTHALINIREVARLALTALTVFALIFVLWIKNDNETRLFDQLEEFREEQRVAEQKAKDIEICIRRYEDEVEFQENRQLGLLSEFVVIIYLFPPNTPEREAGAQEKITELDAVNVKAREANTAKVEYDNLGHPLPCPIGPSEIPEVPDLPDVTTVTTLQVP